MDTDSSSIVSTNSQNGAPAPTLGQLPPELKALIVDMVAEMDDEDEFEDDDEEESDDEHDCSSHGPEGHHHGHSHGPKKPVHDCSTHAPGEHPADDDDEERDEGVQSALWALALLDREFSALVQRHIWRRVDLSDSLISEIGTFLLEIAPRHGHHVELLAVQQRLDEWDPITDNPKISPELTARWEALTVFPDEDDDARRLRFRRELLAEVVPLLPNLVSVQLDFLEVPEPQGMPDLPRDGVVTVEMKREIAVQMVSMQGYFLERAVEIIRQHEPAMLDEISPDVPLDMERLSNSTLLELFRLCHAPLPSHFKLNEVTSAFRKIGPQITSSLTVMGDESGEPRASEEQLASFLLDFPNVARLELDIPLLPVGRTLLHDALVSLSSLRTLMIEGASFVNDEFAKLPWTAPMRVLALSNCEDLSLPSLISLVTKWAPSLQVLELDDVPANITDAEAKKLLRPLELPKLDTLIVSTTHSAAFLALFGRTALVELEIGACPGIEYKNWEGFVTEHAGTLKKVTLQGDHDFTEAQVESFQVYCFAKKIDLDIEEPDSDDEDEWDSEDGEEVDEWEDDDEDGGDGESDDDE
ncbi:hypothetical protein RQP46_001852 [Phenoliferia psychrophenolica]